MHCKAHDWGRVKSRNLGRNRRRNACRCLRASPTSGRTYFVKIARSQHTIQKNINRNRHIPEHSGAEGHLRNASWQRAATPCRLRPTNAERRTQTQAEPHAHKRYECQRLPKRRPSRVSVSSERSPRPGPLAFRFQQYVGVSPDALASLARWADARCIALMLIKPAQHEPKMPPTLVANAPTTPTSARQDNGRTASQDSPPLPSNRTERTPHQRGNRCEPK